MLTERRHEEPEARGLEGNAGGLVVIGVGTGRVGWRLELYLAEGKIESGV